ncbi:MAG: alpha/beta fold hydrolase [Proteobacteria bacterium]|nr:alpha/beta fold hydrolase [Pseudomonadota bacterium]
MQATPITPEKVAIPAVDGFRLQAHVWARSPSEGHGPAPVVVINPATSVHSRYYSRFADFLHGWGFNVITYDYRGIGGSRPHRMRGFEASWLDWGSKDFEGVLRFASQRFAGHPIHVVAHSVGGFLVGMAPSNHLIERVFTMGSQFAYWRDYAEHKRLAMYLRWHVVMPTLTALFGYFPGKRLGWLEDTPRGVVRDWVAPHPRFEDIYRSGPQALSAEARTQLVESFSRVTAPTLALSTSDDEFGTVPAIHRLLRYYERSPSTHLRIEPEALGLESIGHFAFFNARFADSLWRIPLDWLRDGALTDDLPYRQIRLEPRR